MRLVKDPYRNQPVRAAGEDAPFDELFSSRVNLTQRVVESAEQQFEQVPLDVDALPAEFAERVALVADICTIPDDVLEALTIDSLLREFHLGNHEHLHAFWTKVQHTNLRCWISLHVKLMQRPTSGDVIAMFYAMDDTRTRLREDILLDLETHSFERSAALFALDDRIMPLLELSASYSPWWNNVGYDEGARRYAQGCLPADKRERIASAMSLRKVTSVLARQPRYVLQYDVRLDDGSLRRKQTEFVYADEDAGVILMTRTDVAMYEGLRFLNEHDPLTGLYNRTKLFSSMRTLLDQGISQPFAFVHLDIDRFNLYNSSFGEDEGDRLLVFCADLIRDMVEGIPHCIFARLHADVFCVFAPYDPESAPFIIEESNRHLRAYRTDYLLKFSCGLFTVTDPTMNVEEIFAKASIAAKKCKDDYESLYAVYDAAQEQQQRVDLRIEAEMRSALEQQQFKVYLQPKYLIAGDVPCGAEALVRWEHPERGMVSPGHFIPVFERNGFIAKLDYYMWDHVCQLLSDWLAQGLDPNPVSVNISRISLYNPALADVLKRLVADHGIPAALLQLEITESAYMSNPTMMQDTIKGLHEAGFTVLMDDFGSGYSSLNTLKDFPIDILKIDMNFLPDDESDTSGKIIIASVIRMAQWLGMSVIMEGVETADERDFLEGVGCDAIQGYYYSKPLPSAEYERNYVRSVPVPPKAHHAARPQHDQAQTVMVVDDALVMRVMLQRMLEASGYQVILCGSAEEALTAMKRNPGTVDLMLIDNVMEGMSGMDLLEFCHENEELDAIPKFMMTANAQTEVHVRALKLGAKGFFGKPVDKDVVLTYVEREIGRAKGFGF